MLGRKLLDPTAYSAWEKVKVEYIQNFCREMNRREEDSGTFRDRCDYNIQMNKN